MNSLQLHINDIVWFGDDLIKITDIEDTNYHRCITFDLLDETCLFPIKVGWSFFIIHNTDLESDWFYV